MTPRAAGGELWWRLPLAGAALAWLYALTGTGLRVGNWSDVLVLIPAAAYIVADLDPARA